MIFASERGVLVSGDELFSVELLIHEFKGKAIECPLVVSASNSACVPPDIGTVHISERKIKMSIVNIFKRGAFVIYLYVKIVRQSEKFICLRTVSSITYFSDLFQSNFHFGLYKILRWCNLGIRCVSHLQEDTLHGVLL